MSDEPIVIDGFVIRGDRPLIVAKREADLRAKGIDGHPGSIVDYCPVCRAAVRLSPKSQKSMANLAAIFICTLCMETRVMPVMRERGDLISMHTNNEQDAKMFADMSERAGLDFLHLGTGPAQICPSCETGDHDACFGQGCGCKPCFTNGPVKGL